MNRFRVGFLLVIGAALHAPRSTAQQPPSWGELRSGKYAVGFHAWTEVDEARQTNGAGRLVPIAVWFPLSERPSTPSLHYRDYLGVNALEGARTADSAQRNAAAESFAGFLTRNGLPAKRVEAWLSSPMLAQWHGPPADRARPMVLLAQGNGQAAYSQAVLAEYLASRGFVVITTPSPVRTGATLMAESDVYPVAKLQADDLAFAMAVVAGQGTGNPSQVAVVGHSLGGRAGLLLLAGGVTEELISLDGGLGMAAAKGWFDASPIKPEAIQGEVVHIYENTDSLLRPDFDLIRSMVRTRRELIEARGLAHWQFTAFGTIHQAFPDVSPGSASRESDATAAAVVRYTACRLEVWAAHKPGQRRCSAAGLQPQERIPPLSH